MKHLLLITYYWPPAGGVAVQRWLQQVKYLREFGWETTVVTAAGADYPKLDPELEEQVPGETTVIRLPIREPYALYKQLTGAKVGDQMPTAENENKKPSFTKRASLYVRANYFIPDARMLWRRPTVRFLKKWLRENPVDAIASNGTPHTTHLISLDLKRAFPDLPWLADFRDPWTNIDYFADLPLSPRALAKHRHLEKTVMQTADLVTTVSWTWAEDFKKIAGHERVEVLTNGYDPTQYTQAVEADEHFTLYHTGVLGKDRDYPVLWKALARLRSEELGFTEDFRLILIGEVDPAVVQTLHLNQLGTCVERHQFLPQPEVVKRIRGGAMLLLLINRSADAPGRLPSKLYEYLGAERPVLAISPLRGDAAKILEDTGAGELFLTDQETEIYDFLQASYRRWKAGDLIVDSRNTEAFSRRAITKKLSEALRFPGPLGRPV